MKRFVSIIVPLLIMGSYQPSFGLEFSSKWIEEIKEQLTSLNKRITMLDQSLLRLEQKANSIDKRVESIYNSAEGTQIGNPITGYSGSNTPEINKILKRLERIQTKLESEGSWDDSISFIRENLKGLSQKVQELSAKIDDLNRRFPQ